MSSRLFAYVLYQFRPTLRRCFSKSRFQRKPYVFFGGSPNARNHPTYLRRHSSCSFVLRRTADDFREQFSSVTDKVATNFYLGNHLDSFTEEEVIKACKQLADLLSRGGFRLTKWVSSAPAVLESLPSADLMM